MSVGPGGPSAAPDGEAVLADSPPQLWPTLLAALRRAVDRLSGADLPARLRPIAGFAPSKLAADRPRAVVAAALAADARLREVTGEALAGADATVATEVDLGRLRATHGDELAFALLATQARWGEIAVLAADVAADLARAQRAAAERSTTARGRRQQQQAARDAAELATLRAEVGALRADLERAATGERAAQRAAERAEQERNRAEERADALADEVEHVRHRTRRRLERAERRAEEAAARARVDQTRLADVPVRLEELAAELRAGMGAPVSAGEAERPPGTATGAGAPRRRTVDRASMPAFPLPGVRPAEPGRPCRMPSGLVQESPRGVWSLLAVEDLRVLIDAYNVTKDPAGRPLLDLEAQRAWLLGLLGGLAPRVGARFRLVVDATERELPRAPVPKGVRVTFSEGDETADDRLLAIVAALPSAAPVLVVSSDREVRDGAVALEANVVRSSSFLAAVDPEARVAPSA